MAKEENKTITQIIIEALEDYLNEKLPKPSPSMRLKSIEKLSVDDEEFEEDGEFDDVDEVPV
jgi:hypothetical protein